MAKDFVRSRTDLQDLQDLRKDSPKTLIIYLSYAGLGDSLFFSHLPRIAKTANTNGGGGGIMIKSLFRPFLTSAVMITKGLFGRRILMSMAF